jgi:hypothetical protein
MKKPVKIIAALSAVSLAVASFLTGCVLREFGQTPKDLSTYEKFSYFADGTFHSPEPTPYYPDRVSGGRAGWKRYLHLLSNTNAPKTPLPMQKLGKDSFTEKTEELAAYWLGHASLIIELEGRRFLVDPVFGNAAPVPFVVRRYGPPPLARKELPPC